MGEGEVCVVVVSNVGDMETEKVQQKRDHQWLTGGSDTEPLTKKQAKEGIFANEGESCDRVQSEVEQDPCLKTLGINGIELEPCVEQEMAECSDALELEPCDSNQTTKDLNDIKPNTSVEETKQQNCEGTQTKESLNYIDVNPFVVKEGPHDMELDACVPSEVPNDMETVLNAEQPVKDEMELEPQGTMQGTGDEIEIDTCSRMQKTEARSDMESEPSIKESPSETELEASGKMQPTEAFQQPDDKCLNVMEPEVCGSKQTTQALDGTGTEKQSTDALNETKKEASNDDICSEVSNPNVSPRDNSSSFQTVNSQPDGKLVMKDQVVCGEITSACSGNSSSESTQEEHGINGTVSTSHVILEVPKHASTSSGIRKITFKFSKRKEDSANCTNNTFDNPTHKVPSLAHISEHESVKVIPEGYPTTVKRLLSTGILDGAKVKYISTSGELIGIVKDCGYLCGCVTCNFSSILKAHEFEEHAGGKTRHPNNHIYLENGKPIYSIIQAMKASPLSTVDEAIKNVAGSSVNEELLQVWKVNLQRNMDMGKPDNNYHMKLMNLYHSTTSCSNNMSEDGSSPHYCYRKSFPLEPQTFVNETAKERKCLFKKPRSYTPTTVVEPKRSAEGGHKKRDNDLHRLLFMPNGLPDGTELAYYARGKKILDGYKQGNGIVCSHCDTEISPSQFEAHAGWAAKRQPYRHIYISNGVTLHDIALLLANGQSIATSNSDDMCAVCGDRGDLIICDGCPHAFHSVCLGLEGIPSEDPHCPYCKDSIGSGRKTAAESRPIVIRLTRVVKAREYETGGCVICRAHDFSVADFDDRTVMLCDQCEKEYHVGCLREGGICDLKALPSDKWFCCNHCDMIHGAMQEVVANGASAISGLALSRINKKHIFGNDIRWRMLSGKSRYPEHLPLLSRAAAIFRECFDPIVAKSGRDLIPVMVYGRNISGQEFGGIYCVVLMVGSVVVSAGLLRIFGQEVAELPLVATSRQHQGKGYFQALFFCIEELLLSLGVQILVLPAAEEAESIWTKKLGFRKMTDDRYTQYSRDIQLTIFKGTSMLEKELHGATL